MTNKNFRRSPEQRETRPYTVTFFKDGVEIDLDTTHNEGDTMTQSERTPGAIGTLLNREAIDALLPDVMVNGDLLLLETTDGTAVIGTEGVGHVVDGAVVAVHASFGRSNYYEPYDLPIDAVREAATGEQRDLADHVRVFGSRLEINFRLWYNLAIKADD